MKLKKIKKNPLFYGPFKNAQTYGPEIDTLAQHTFIIFLFLKTCLAVFEKNNSKVTFCLLLSRIQPLL
jgi:hypothetical protein